MSGVLANALSSTEANQDGGQPRRSGDGQRLVRLAAAAAEPCRGQLLGTVLREFSRPATRRTVSVQAPRPAQRYRRRGIFAYATALPCSLAWEAFGQANGVPSAHEMLARIARLRRADPGERHDFEIGCRILTQPVFFDETDWIPVPPSWARTIVSFKTYTTRDADGRALWEAVNERMTNPSLPGLAEEPARFGGPQLVHPRLGQGAFRVLVTDIYKGVARSRTSEPCPRSKLRISGPMAMAARTRPGTGSCFGVTSTACSMRAT